MCQDVYSKCFNMSVNWVVIFLFFLSTALIILDINRRQRQKREKETIMYYEEQIRLLKEE